VKIYGNVIRVHANDVDPWPSNPHGHIQGTRNVVDKTGNIFDKVNRNKVGQLSKKGAKAFSSFLGRMSQFGILLFDVEEYRKRMEEKHGLCWDKS
jgi:hypothetical protein